MSGRGTRIRALALAVAAVLVLAVLVPALGWRLNGGSWAVVSTPSMGTAVPVGTLIIVRPARLADLRVGQVISYRPRGTSGVTYTHRVISRLPDGTVRVRGDLNGAPDPYPVRQQDLAGLVVASWPGVGWLIRAAPFLLVGGLVLMFGSARLVSDRWRSSVRVIGVCLLVTICVLVLRPLVRPVLIGVSTRGETTMASVVSAGLLPTQVVGSPGDAVTLRLGEAGVVPVASDYAGGPMVVNGRADLHGWWLVGMIGVCLSPLLWCLLIGLSPQAPPDPAPEADS